MLDLCIPRWQRIFLKAAGVFSAAHLMLVTGLGLIVRHARVLHLDHRYVGRGILPGAYHAGQAAVRADILVSDLFSALLVGHAGGFMLDVLAIFWAATAVVAVVLGFQARGRRRGQNLTVREPQPLRAAMMGAPRAPRGSGKVLEFRQR